jgi:hypothetical protein
MKFIKIISLTLFYTLSPNWTLDCSGRNNTPINSRFLSNIESDIILTNSLDTSNNEVFFVHLLFIHKPDMDSATLFDSTFISNSIKNARTTGKKALKNIISVVFVNGNPIGCCLQKDNYKLSTQNDIMFYGKEMFQRMLVSREKVAYSIGKLPWCNVYVQFFYEDQNLITSMYLDKGESILLGINDIVRNHYGHFKQLMLDN